MKRTITALTVIAAFQFPPWLNHFMQVLPQFDFLRGPSTAIASAVGIVLALIVFHYRDILCESRYPKVEPSGVRRVEALIVTGLPAYFVLLGIYHIIQYFVHFSAAISALGESKGLDALIAARPDVRSNFWKISQAYREIGDFHSVPNAMSLLWNACMSYVSLGLSVAFVATFESGKDTGKAGSVSAGEN